MIIGNGPSLNKTDMSLLRNVPTFGLNRSYLAFDRWGFTPTYHVAVNQYVVSQSAEELAQLSAPLFTTWRNAATMTQTRKRCVYLHNDQEPGFYGDARRGIWEGATVTYVALQLAFYMGFGKVVLIGVDHDFATKGEPHKLVQSVADDPNHFDPNYFGAGYKWQLPDLQTSAIAYEYAREAYKIAGRDVIDSTVGGKLTVFPKVELAVALKSSGAKGAQT